MTRHLNDLTDVRGEYNIGVVAVDSLFAVLGCNFRVDLWAATISLMMFRKYKYFADLPVSSCVCTSSDTILYLCSFSLDSTLNFPQLDHRSIVLVSHSDFVNRRGIVYTLPLCETGLRFASVRKTHRI